MPCFLNDNFQQNTKLEGRRETNELWDDAAVGVAPVMITTGRSIKHNDLANMIFIQT